VQTYYETLEITRGASFDEINTAFKQLALRYHPMRNPTNMSTNHVKFQEICEAYDVLSTVELKAVYDTYGEYALKEGITTPDGKSIGGRYFLKESPFHVFEKFFTKTDPFGHQNDLKQNDVYSTLFGDAFGGQKQAAKSKPEDIVITLEASLEELYNGSIKYVEYEREVIQHDAKTTRLTADKQIVEVKSGFSTETSLTFKGKGHQEVGHEASNLVVKFAQKEHEKYRRIGDDLILTEKITLEDALNQKPVCFKTLDGRNITMGFDELISP